MIAAADIHQDADIRISDKVAQQRSGQIAARVKAEQNCVSWKIAKTYLQKKRKPEDKKNP